MTNSKVICPKCGAEMVAGEVTIKSNVGLFFVIGLSQMFLMFRAKGEKQEKNILWPRTTKKAHLCEDCSTVLIEDVDT